MFSGRPLDKYQLQKILKEKRQGCVLPTKYRTIIRRLWTRYKHDFFFFLIFWVSSWEWRDLNPRYLRWKHQEVSIELQGSWHKHDLLCTKAKCQFAYVESLQITRKLCRFLQKTWQELIISRLPASHHINQHYTSLSHMLLNLNSTNNITKRFKENFWIPFRNYNQ